MTALAIVPTVRNEAGAVVAILRPVPFLARCPGCERHPHQPEARACDRLGCPIRHFARVDHGEASA